MAKEQYLYQKQDQHFGKKNQAVKFEKNDQNDGWKQIFAQGQGRAVMAACSVQEWCTSHRSCSFCKLREVEYMHTT